MSSKDKQSVLQFLKNLQTNNSKEWMDQNRKVYHETKDIWITIVEQIQTRLSQHNPYLGQIAAKKTLSRINNNRRFHPDKPVYKDFFSYEAAGKQEGLSLFYLSIGVSWSFVGGGLHNPTSEQLKAFRAAIDYDGAAFRSIIHSKPFVSFYTSLTHFQEPLKTSPSGYNQDHPYIEYLRYKSITATRNISEDEFLSDDFVDLIEEGYIAFRPLETFLLQALTMTGEPV